MAFAAREVPLMRRTRRKQCGPGTDPVRHPQWNCRGPVPCRSCLLPASRRARLLEAEDL